MASLVLGVAGAAIGSMVGMPTWGAQLGFALGSAAGGILFPPKGPDGPRLTDLSVHTSAYGQGIPIPYGSDRVAGNVIWADKIQEHKQDHGGGSGGPTYTTYSYTCSFAVSIVVGPIAGILRIWADGLLIFDRSPTNTGETVGFKSSSYKIYLGDETQLPDPTIQSIIGDTPAYRGQAYMVLADLQLEKFGNRIPSLSFEYVTDGSAIIPAPSTYGEAYGITPLLGQYDKTFSYDVDQTTGHLWITSMSGHAMRDPVTGAYRIDTGVTPHPQVQEYDPVTKTMLSFIDLAPLSVNGQPQYGISGTMVASGGYLFSGLGVAGEAAGGGSYAHGLAINTALKSVAPLIDQCSSGQYQNAFYWPAVPVPAIDNNKVYLAGSNGIDGGFALAFFPASVLADPFGLNGPPTTVDYDPIPNFAVEPSTWTVPVGWAQTRSKNASCPVPPVFDGVAITFPGWAYKSTVLTQPNAVVVQGYGSAGHSYLALVNSPQVTGFDKTAATVRHCELPGSQVVMPTIVWDSANQKLWAFPEVDTYTSLMYEIVQGVSDLTAVDTGFLFPKTAGSFRSGSVVGATVDQTSGHLRILMFDGEMILFDPMSQAILDSQQTGVQPSQNGKMWDYPGAAKVLFADGFKIHDIPYGSPLATSPVLLADIVTDLSERSGLTESDIDVTDLTDQVLGFTISHQMAARSALEPLMQAFFFDPVESDYKVRFRKRGRPAVVTIVDDDLAAHSAGGSPPDLVEVKRKQETDLPQVVNIKYKNPAADYQTSAQYEARQVGRSHSAVTVDLPIVMDDEKAKQVAAAALYSAWAERTGLTFATSHQYATLEPTDMAIVHNRLVRIVHRKRSGGLIEWEAYADGNTIYASEVLNQGGSAAPAGLVGQIILTTPLTSMQILDTPLLQDTDAAPGFYIAAAGMKAGWQGAQVWKSVDGGVSYLPLITIPNASLMGTASNALGPYAGGDTFDELNTLTVSLLANGSTASLESATEQAVLNGANAALVGNEVIQYKRAVLNDNGTYTISGLLRYRRGTDAAVHTAGERFVALSTNLVRVTVPTSDIGLPRVYKAISNGGTLAEAAPVPFTYTGADLKPYSPVQIDGWRNAAGDLAITWVRRTRIGGEWREYVDVPLGEASEAYYVELWNAGRTTLLRTLSGLTSPAATYSAADQTTDGITSSDQVSASVFQISATIGRGHGAHALLPGGATVAEQDPAGAAVVVSAPPVPGLTPTLYVATTGSDSNAGTSMAAPFLTIAHASSVAVPGDVVSVADGVYHGGLYTNASGTLALPITFIAANRWGAKIVPPAASSSIFAWDNTGAYNVIDGFEVDGSINPTSGTVWTVGIRVKGEGSVIQHCHSHHIYHIGVANSNGGAGLLLDSSDSGQNMRALGNRVHHVGPPTGGSAWYHGIYMTASGQIKNNLSYANAGGGIHCWHDARHIDIANNTVFANGGYGIIYGGGDYLHLSSPCDYMTVTNNIVYSNPTGIRELGDIGSHNLVSTNLCYANGTDYSLSVSSHSSDIHADPLFVNYQADGSGDYRLQAGSPGIGAGLATYAPSTDYAGNPRPGAGGFDLGAYESN